MVDTTVQHRNGQSFFEAAGTHTNWATIIGQTERHDGVSAVIGLTYNNAGIIYGQRDGFYFGGGPIATSWDPNTYEANYEYRAFQGGVAKLTNSGSIFGGPGNGADVPAGAGVEFGTGVGTAILTNHASGAIDGPVGVYSEATDTRISNAGSIGGDIGIELQGLAAGRITNSGLIAGTSIGILANAAAGFAIRNSGTITGDSEAILLQAAGSSILNTGTIDGNDLAVRALGVSTVDNRGVISGGMELRGTLKNSGDILGEVSFGADNDLVINSGSFDSDLSFGGGNDLYRATEGGIVLGEIRGGAGNDTLKGGAENDILLGGDDHDDLHGGRGSDQIWGGLGNDTIWGSSSVADPNDGRDFLYGEEGNDLMNGNGGDDDLYGGAGNDTLRGGKDNDVLYGEADNDVLLGNIGNDTLDGGAGQDWLTGGTENDLFVFVRGEAHGDTIFDFAGNGSLVGDAIRFVGYGAGTFSMISATQWQVVSSDGLTTETITFANSASIDSSDYLFA